GQNQRGRPRKGRIGQAAKTARGRIHRLSEEAWRESAEAVRAFAGIVFAAVAIAAANYRVDFRNIAKEAGLTQSFPNGGEKSKQFIIETTGSGAAFIDYDNDGLLDIFLRSCARGYNRLSPNAGSGHCVDVTT